MANRGKFEIERSLREAFAQYSESGETGDLLPVIFQVHTALEDAANLQLPIEVPELSFIGKMTRLVPMLVDRHSLEDINRQRNHLAHLRKRLKDDEVRVTARGFVHFAWDAWPTLLGPGRPPLPPDPVIGSRIARPSSTQPVTVQPADLSEPPQTVPAPLPAAPIPLRQTSLNSRIKTRKEVKKPSAWLWKPLLYLPWGSLILGSVVLAITLALTGFCQSLLSQGFPITSYRFLIPGLVWLVCLLLTLRFLGRFLSRLGLGRLIFGLGAWILVFTLWLALTRGAAGSLPQRLGSALYLSLSRSVEGVTEVGAMANELGHQMGRAFSHEAQNAEVGMAGAGEVIAVTETTGVTHLSTATVETQPTARSQIEPGATVIVRTNGSRLRGRAGPGINEPVEAWFRNGDQLTVLEGPETVDGHQWWKVEGAAGSGWSAGEFLRLAP